MSEKDSRSSRKLRSLIRGLFLGQTGDEFVYPFPEQDAEEKENTDLALDSFRQWADENLDSVAIDREQAIPESVQQGFAELGMMGFSIPEEYGGYGFSYTAYCRLMEEVCRRDGALATHLGGHLSIGCKALMLHGNEEQKRQWLPKCATGEVVSAFALTEPSAGSDPAGMLSRAVWDEDRNRWILNGNKIWCTNGGHAKLFTVCALTTIGEGDEAQDRVTAFVVERGAPGFSSGLSEHKMGIRGSSTAELAFEDVEIPPENVIGRLGGGLRVALEVLNTGRLSLAAGCIGSSKEMLEMSLRHAMEREQFKTRIVDFEQIRRKLSAMTSGIYAMESMVYLTTGLADRGVTDFSLESAACKVFCAEENWRIVNHAVQIVGGIGYMTEYPYERFLRDSRINMIFEGTDEVLRMFIALTGLQKPGQLLRRLESAIKSPVSGVGDIAKHAGRRLRDITPERPGWVAEPLRDEGMLLARAAHDLARASEDAIREHKKRIMQRGYIQARLANAAMDVFAMAASLSRASTRVAKEGAELAERDILLARAFCREAAPRVAAVLERVRKADDSVHDTIAESLKERGAYLTPLF